MGKSWKIPLYLLLFGIATIISVFFKDVGQKTYSPAEVLGVSGNLEIFVQPESGKGPILEAIKNAQSEVLAEVYLLSDKEIISAMEEAKNRGVKVQVMMEQHPFGGGNVNQTTSTRFSSSGIDFKWTNPTFALTHEKVLIIDRKQVFILNQNLTMTASTKNREFNIIDNNSEDVLEAVNIFNADWKREGYSPKAKNLVVSPDNSRGKLTALINSAARTIEMEMEIMEDDDMIKLLGARGQGLGVRIILPDFKKVPSNKDSAEKLQSAGVQVRTLSSPYIHAKMILVDGERAYTGSVNFSTASLEQNRELGILISQEDIVQKLSETFENDWNRAL